MSDDDQHPLRPLVRAWLTRLKAAGKHKNKAFQEDAEEAMRFFNGPHNWMFNEEANRSKKGGYFSDRRGAEAGEENTEEMLPPSFRICINKVAELRDLYGAQLYHQNPDITVEPHDPPPPPPQALGIVQPPPDPRPPQMTAMGPIQPPPTPQEAMFQQQMMQYQQLQQQQNDRATVNGFRAQLMQYVLNYTQRKTDKKTHGRRVIDEALIKGMGIFHHKLVERDGMQGKIIGTFYKNCDDYLMDPDARTWQGVWWIALREVEPLWEIERKFNLPAGALDGKGRDTSIAKASTESTDPDYRDNMARGKTNDLGTYWTIYSKMGMGDKLGENANGNAAGNETQISDPGLQKLAGAFDELGPYCMISVMEGVPYPLNLHDDLIRQKPNEEPEADEYNPIGPQEEGGEDDKFELPQTPVVDPQTQQPAVDPMTGEPQMEIDPQISTAVQWPIPYFALGSMDDSSWPTTPLYFHEVPGDVWPMSHIKPGIGLLRFINWVFSFLAGKVRKNCTTTIGVMKAAGEDVKAQLLNGKDFQLLEIEHALSAGGKITDLVSVLQYPEVNGDIWKMIEAVIGMFEQATGLDELMYGQTAHAYRSAAEANAKQNNMQLRPDDMANKVEDCLSKCAAKEAMAMRWLYEPEDVLPIVGPLGAQAWQSLIQSASIEEVVSEFDYRVEAGTARKPNREGRIAAINAAGQAFGPFLSAWAEKTGDPTGMNALMQEWAEANNVKIPVLQPPPPPQAPPPGQPREKPKPNALSHPATGPRPASGLERMNRPAPNGHPVGVG